ncbi:MAG: DUF5309 domain-containing protein [Paramuribaculum sp.]|nr:DUF5309 domain-containing protein [Paramuribaculum sp.]
MENNATVTTGFAGGNNVTDGVLTTTMAREASPSLLRNETDDRVARIRPMATPVDSISRMIGARKCHSMVVDYYTVDSKKPTVTAMSNLKDTGTIHSSGKKIYTLQTAESGAFAVSDTIYVPDVSSDPAPGTTSDPLMLYVIGSTPGTGEVTVIGINAGNDGAIDINFAGKSLVRMGRAAGELDVQTPQFEALPRKDTNYCQIFKAQIEQSHIMRQSAKEVGWTFSDQEEVAVMDMRMSMEKSFVFGVKARLEQPERCDEVMFTGGIWNQAASTATYSKSGLNMTQLTAIMKTAFCGSAAGSSRKILFAGSGLIAELNNLEHTKVLLARDRVTRWGVDFNEVTSKFGTLMVVHSEVFDQCGHENDGLIVDPYYMTKYVHVPFKYDRLDMKRSGTRNTEATVLTEASCLVLRNPEAHVKVIGE